MRSLTAWRDFLRSELRAALRAKDVRVVSLVREVLSAIDHAEVPSDVAPPRASDGPIAGSVEGLGVTEVLRKVLAPEDVTALLHREVEVRRAACEQYGQLGRVEEARVLELQLAMLEAWIRGGTAA